MASNTIVSINHPDGALLENPSSAAGMTSRWRETLIELSKFFAALAGGFQPAAPGGITVDVSRVSTSGAPATGTATCVGILAADTVTINGVTFTAVAAGATAYQFNLGGSDAATAANLAAQVNANADALIAGIFTASVVANVVTFTAYLKGKAGNAVTLASSTGVRAAVSGTRLTGGTGGSGTIATFSA